MPPETAMWIGISITVLAGCGLLTALVLGPIGRALGDRLSGRRDALAGDADERLERIERLLEGRVGDLEDRIAFTERLLSGRAEESDR